MKKSEMTVSMPLTTWEEYESYKKKYAELTEKMGSCFDCSLFDVQHIINFDINKALVLCKEFLSYQYQNAEIAKIE